MPPCALRVRPSRGPISLLRTWKQPSVRFGGSVTARAAPRPRVVVDTGVVVSAFAFGGVPARALRAALSTSDVCVSGDLLAEYRNIPDALRAARKVNAEQWQALLAGIAAFVAEARLIEPTRLVRVCRDPKDDMVLECCRAARANFLITGDRDLLNLDVSRIAGLRRLRIVSPRTYVDRC